MHRNMKMLFVCLLCIAYDPDRIYDEWNNKYDYKMKQNQTKPNDKME